MMMTTMAMATATTTMMMMTKTTIMTTIMIRTATETTKTLMAITSMTRMRMKTTMKTMSTENSRIIIPYFFIRKTIPIPPLIAYSFPLLPLLKSLLVYFSGFYLYSRHTPTCKEVVQPPFLYFIPSP